MAAKTFRQSLLVAVSFALTVCLTFAQNVQAQISDTLDSYPPRWSLVSSDCQAEMQTHSNLTAGGIQNSGCESISLRCRNGTQALLEYRIEPVHVIDELTATVHLRSNKSGQRVGLRVRFPYQLRSDGRESVSTIVYGTDYRDATHWQKLGIGAISSQLRLKTIALRSEYGPQANLNDAFVDAIIINAYVGPGDHELQIDNVTVDGMVAVNHQASIFGSSARAAKAASTGDSELAETLGTNRFLPVGRILKILQHRGEPLDWVRTLGFDAVLLSKPVDERILKEAALARVSLISPPPTAPDIALEPHLEPLVAYYLGTSVAEQDLTQVAESAKRVRGFPTRWRRPILLAPAENWREYAEEADGLIHDLPHSIRGLSADEEIATISDRIARTVKPVAHMLGVQSDAPESLLAQLNQIGATIGAERGNDVPWQALQLQVARALHWAPTAIVFRSARSLTSGLPEDQRRSMALSYLNRYLDVVGPMVKASSDAQSLRVTGASYRCSRIPFKGGELLLASSFMQHKNLVAAGDGDSLQLHLPPGDSIKMAWRITHFAAERLRMTNDKSGSYLEIISPDTVESIVLASDPEMGGRLSQALKQVANQAALDRWQLSHEAITQLMQDWQLATASHSITPATGAVDLLTAAKRTIDDAEPVFRSGDAASAIRMVRRADAWQLKSRWSLTAAMYPGGKLQSLTSVPSLVSTGGVPIQVMWTPLMQEPGWGKNRMVGGSLDDPGYVNPSGWTFGRRLENRTTAEVRVESGRQIEGSGCLTVSVSPAAGLALPGGYAGTTLQISSPGVRIEARRPVRIDAKVRTLGFGGPDQGVLVFDSVGGNELGVLVRATPQWQDVHLYRQTTGEGEVKVFFETMGAGEVMIDDVQIHVWEPANQPATPPLRRIAERQ